VRWRAYKAEKGREKESRFNKELGAVIVPSKKKKGIREGPEKGDQEKNRGLAGR